MLEVIQGVGVDNRIGALVDRARAAAGLSQRGLADKAGISQATLSRIISGDRVAKMPEIIAIAWATGHTVAQITGAGTIADRLQWAARATNGTSMEAMQRTLLYFMELDDYLDDYAIPGKSWGGVQRSAEAEGETAAAEFRRQHRLGVQPIGELADAIERATGFDVAILDATPDEHGLAVHDPQRNVVFIGVARTQHPMRQRSTLGHELGHVIFKDWRAEESRIRRDRSYEEIRADAFARHLLVPVEGLREMLGPVQSVSDSVLSTVVQGFGVSPAIAAIALENAGYIDNATKHRWMKLTAHQLAFRFGWSDKYYALQAESGQRRAPQRLLARAIEGYAEGVLPAQAIATLRAIPEEAAESELHEAGITPRPIRWSDPAELPPAHVDQAALDEALSAPDHFPDTTPGDG